MLKDESWFYCEHCECIAYKCDTCGLGSCSGGGCDICLPLWKQVAEAILLGNHPHPLLPPLI